MFSTHNHNESNTISEAKMEKIIDAILQGQYSQACLLLLEATSRNPLHYIPYRTYNRLQKQRQQAASYLHDHQPTTTTPASVTALKPRIADLDYIENLSEKTPSIKGGQSLGRDMVRWLHSHVHISRSNHRF